MREHGLKESLQQIGPTWLYIHLCAVGTVAFTLYDHQGLPDMFFMLPYFAVISAWVFDQLVAKLEAARGRVAGWVGVGLCTVMFIFLSTLTTWLFKAHFTLPEQYRLAERVGEFVAEGQSVYAIGCPHLLAFNHVNNWTNFIYFSKGQQKLILHETGETFRPAQNGVWPSIILMARRAPDGSKEWLEEKYEDVTTPDFKAQWITVYRLKPVDGLGVQ